MLDYIFLLVGAIIIFPVLYYLLTRGKAGKAMVIMAAAGFLIALAGIYIQNHFAFYYSALAMIGLSFAAAVLIANRLPGETVTDGVPDELSEPIRLEDERLATDDDEIDVIPEDVRAGILAEESDTIEPGGYREIVLPGSANIEHPPEDLRMDHSVGTEIEDGELEVLTDLDTPEVDLVPETVGEAVSPDPIGDEDYLEPIDLPDEPATEESVQTEPAFVDEEDYLLDDGDLESWLEARPVPEPSGDLVEEQEMVRDEDPFGLLTEEDWIVEEEKGDGK